MATTSKYFLLPSTGANFIDFNLSYGSVSLQGQEIVFVGSTTVDAVFVRPGVVVDMTLSGASADKIYLSGNQADYTASLAGSVMTLTRGSGETLEAVRFIKAATITPSDKIIFADGTLSSFDLYANLKDGTALPVLSGETSLAPAAPAAEGSTLNANIKAFALDASGETFAMAKHGIALTVVGGVGIDKVYVPDGGSVDATLLGGNSDLIYFRGNWSDYAKTVAGSTITFTRSIDGLTESVKVVAGSTVTLNDKLIFADAAVLSNNAKLAVSANLNAAISDVTGFDVNTITPGIDSTPPTLDVAALGDGNLTAAEATAAGGVVSVTTENGASVSVVFTGSGAPVTKQITGNGTAQGVVLDANDLASLGDGAVAVATTSTDAFGNATTSTDGGFNLDTAAPVLASAQVNGDVLTLTYTDANGLDAVNKAATGDFTVLVNASQVEVSNVAVSGNNVNLTLVTAVADGAIASVSYSGSGANAIQDAAGNDAAVLENRSVDVPSGSVADGYIRDAHIYIDTNGDGSGDHDTGTSTNASGNFFLPAGTPSGTIIAIGGVNIDTGLPNTLIYKAPAGSTTVSPLTTLIQDYVDANNVSAAVAETEVQNALGLPAGVDLFTFDPLAASPTDADAVAVQIAATQIATIAMLAASAPADGSTSAKAAQEVFDNLVASITNAAGTVDLSDAGTATGLLGSATEVEPTKVSLAAADIGGSDDFSEISDAQAAALDDIAPAAPIAAPDLLAISDSGRLTNDDITTDTTPTVRVRFNATATDGTAVVVGNTAKVFDGESQIGSGVISEDDLANGYIDITASALTNGQHALNATLTDSAVNTSIASASLSINIDTAAPTTSLGNLALSTDSGSSASDFITKSAAQTVSATLSAALGADEFVYGSTDNGATWSEITGSVSGTSLAWNTVLRSGTNTLQLKVSDAAGNNGPTSSQTYTLDTTQPVLTVAGLGDGNLRASEATDAGGVITVNTEVGANVGVVFSGASGSVNKALVGDGSTQVVTLTSGDLTTLGNGAVNVTTTATDVAGNARLSTVGGFNLDTAAPATPTINAVATDDMVNATEKTAGVSVSGTAESGSSVNVTWGATTHTVTAASGSWTASFSAGEIPADGTMNISAQATDIAGNVSSSGSRTVTVDTLAPTTATAPTLSASSDTGVLGDGITSDTTPTITGVSEANASITLMDDLGGGAFSVLGTTTANASGAWSITSSTLSEGTHHLIANAQDAAFNVASFSALDLTIGADQSGPVLQSASVNGGILTLTYNEALDPAHQPASSYFLATVNGNNRGIGNAAISGNSVQLSFLSPVSQGDNVTVSYSDPSAGNDVNAVQDAVGNDATGFVATAVTNLTSGNATSTGVVSASFSTANGSISYIFNEPMQASSPSGVTILKNGTGGNILTGASFSADGYTLTFTTSASLSNNDFVVVTYNGGGDLRDMDGNPVSQGTLVIGGGNANTINLESLSGTHGQFTVRGNSGDDTIFGSGSNDSLYGNAGSDTINGGWGQDNIRVFDGTSRASDTVAVWDEDESGSQPYYYDSVYGFDVSGTTINDKLDLPSNAIAASTAGFVNGIDVGAVKSHSISTGGMLTFGGTDAGTPVLINAGNLNDATAYLLQNLTAPGQAMAFAFDNDGNGQADSLFVYQNGGGSDFDNNVLVKLVGVNGATLGTSAAQNVVQLVDSSAPHPTDASFSNAANAVFSLSFNENVLLTDTTGLSLLKNGAGGNIVTGVSTNGNLLNIQTNATLAATDYVLFAYDGATGNVRDVNNNSMTSMLPGIAVGGTGNTTIDLSALSGEYGIYDPSGNNTLIGNADENWLDGGSGNDTLNGGAGNDELTGSTGADNLNGGAGEDEFSFEQGDSTSVSYNAGVYTFAGNVADVISGGFDVAATNLKVNMYNDTGDRIELRAPIPGQDGISYMGAAPADGLVTDQSYYLTRGNYSAGVFTNNAAGNDTLVVYDGNSAIGAASQTALVLQGVNPSELTATNWGDIYLGIVSNVAPFITSNGGGANASIVVMENTTAVSTVTASDADGDNLAYNISGGADAAKFSIDPNNGALTFLVAPNFEAPTDAGGNNVYDIVVLVSDGQGGSDTQTIAVTVANQNEGITEYGTEDGETLTGSDDSDSLYGLFGNDTLTGNAGDDLLDGGPGTDMLDGGPGNDTLNAGVPAGLPNAEGDTLIGGDGNDTLTSVMSVSSPGVHTHDGNNLQGGTGNDSIELDGGGSISGGDGNDTIKGYFYGSTATLTASGGTGIDTYQFDGFGYANGDFFNSATTFNYTITDFTPGAGGDRLDILNQYGLLETAAMYGGYVAGNPFDAGLGYLRLTQSGADTLFQIDIDGAAGSVGDWKTVVTLQGVDKNMLTADNFVEGVLPSGSPNTGVTLPGTANADNYQGTYVADQINGLGGNDYIKGGFGGDTLLGGIGNDVLYGEYGNDSLYGEDGGDILDGGPGSDILDGGIGDDMLYGGINTSALAAEGDTLIGGEGNDFLSAPMHSNSPGNYTHDGNDLQGGAGNDTIELNGGGVISGGDGNDSIKGFFWGSSANLVASGGSGIDTYQFDGFGYVNGTFFNSPTTFNYSITDFIAGAGGDRIDLTNQYGLLDTIEDYGYAGSDPFDTGLGYLRLEQSGADTLFQIDIDGAAGAVATWKTVVTLQGVNAANLTAENFITVANLSAPVITSNGASANANINVSENTTTVTTVTASDADGNSLAYSISGGTDAAKFSIDANTGVLTFVDAPNFEAPTDQGPNNVYDVIVQASDGINTDTQAIAVTVTNVNEVGDSDYAYIYGDPGVGQPRVNEVRLQNDIDSHQPGETLVEYVSMDQPVIVTGTPQLQLVIGTAGDMHTVLANYDAANSSGNQLAFNYTMQSGDVGQLSVGNLYFPAGSNITNQAGTLSAFARIDNTGNNQAGTWLYGAASTISTALNDWIAPPVGSDLGDAAKLTTALSGLNAGTGGDRDMLAFNLKYFGGALEGTPLANGFQIDIDSRVIRVLNESGTINLYEVVGGTPQLVKTLNSGGAGFERLTIVITDPTGTPLGPDYVADLQLLKGTYTDLIRNNQMNHGSMFADTITLPADPSAFQMVWPDDGDDVVIGSNNGDHSDVSDGNDSISLGSGDDHFGWWGTGSSTLDGGSGNDTLTISGGIATELDGDISYALAGDGKLHMYAGVTEFAVIEQGGAGDAWQYRITSMEEVQGDMVATLKDIEQIQVGNQSDWLSLTLSSSLFVVADNTAPVSTGAFFSNTTNAVITLSYSEAVTGTSVAGLSLSLNPGQANDWEGTQVNLSGMPGGLGTATVTLSTSSTLAATDVVRLRYDAAPGDLADLAANPVPSVEIWMGGSGANEIDLDDYWTYLPVTLRGNGGNDILVGTYANDLLLDGSGADTLLGGWGADSIILVENGDPISFSRDVVKFELGESIYGAMDVIRSSATSPTTSGFDIASATAANHDVLDLPSNTIATDASNVDGVDGGGISRHSVANGIVSFLDAGGNPMLAGNVSNALSYLSANFTTPGVTVAFKADTDSNGAVDSLYVFQDNGTVPLIGNLVLPDTLVKLQNLIGIESVALGTSAGANVVQIVDTQAPDPVGTTLTADGIRFDFSENAFVPAAGATNLALTMQKNGTGAVLSPTSVDGNGSINMTLHYALTLAPEDWAMMHYAGTGTADGIRDASGNALIEEAGGFGFAEGGSGNNTINLSALSGEYDLNGNAGNDILIGSSGESWIVGGTGADTMTGGDGPDEFEFEQGDSPAVTARNLGADGLLNNGDTFSFANGVDRVTDLSNDEAIALQQTMSDYLGNLGGLNYMGSLPANGLVTDQGYFALQGAFNAGVFTANTAGTDTLIVWDGDASSAVTQTGIVLSGVQVGELQLGGSWIQLYSASGFSNANDTYELPLPSVIGQTVDARGGSDTLLMSFYPNLIVPDGHSLHFGDVLNPTSITASSIVFDLENTDENVNNYHLSGKHDVLSASPVTDYDISLQNFEHIRFDDGIDVLEIDLANDIGMIEASQAVSGVLNGLILAADTLFASYEAGAGVSQIIGGAQMADTVGFQFDGVEEIQMVKDESGDAPVWRFSEGSEEVFTLVQAGNNWSVDYASNGGGTDVTFSNIEYVAVMNNLDDVLLRLSFTPSQPQIIV